MPVEIKQWLEDNGFSVMHRNACNTWFNYVNIKEYSTSIELYEKNGKWFCKASGFLGKTFNKVESMEYAAPNNNIFIQMDRLQSVMNWYDSHMD